MSKLLTTFAPALDVAAIHPTFGHIAAWNRLNEPLWPMNRHLWSRYVVDAFGIQLLTTEHLDKANDLSAWQVSKVTADRWLVRAPDLSPWFDVPDALSVRRHQFPAPDRADRGG